MPRHLSAESLFPLAWLERKNHSTQCMVEQLQPFGVPYLPLWPAPAEMVKPWERQWSAEGWHHYLVSFPEQLGLVINIHVHVYTVYYCLYCMYSVLSSVLHVQCTIVCTACTVYYRLYCMYSVLSSVLHVQCTNVCTACTVY